MRLFLSSLLLLAVATPAEARISAGAHTAYLHEAVLAHTAEEAAMVVKRPGIDRADWERFLQPAPLPEKALKAWLGYAPKVEPEEPAIHYCLRGLSPYAGGVDLFTDGHGAVESATFYLAIGPLYTQEHIDLARKAETAYTLAQVEKWYGAPAERTVFKRTGADRLIYHFQGDAKRTLTFTALPGSRSLHSISADRGEE